MLQGKLDKPGKMPKTDMVLKPLDFGFLVWRNFCVF